MTCNEIENRLPAYMEGLLSPEDRKSIEGHLASCSRCGRALADLKTTEELVRGLEDVEPPPFFEQRIMSRVREEAGQKKGILQRFFYPLYIKVPVQVMVTVFVAVFAFYVYQKGEPEMKQEVSLPIPMTEDAKGRVISEPPGVVSVPLAVPRAERAPAGDITGKKDQKPGAPAPRAKGDDEEKSITDSRAPIREGRSSPIKPTAPIAAAREKDMPSVESKALNAMRDKAEIQAGGASATAMTQQTSKGKTAAKRSIIDLTMHVGRAPDAVREIEERLGRFNARIIDRQRREGEEILRIEIARQTVAAFLDQLNAIGRIDEEKSAPAVPDGNVTVIIKIKEQGRP
jgi:hypothetical protein